jgi:hypothetical protein
MANSVDIEVQLTGTEEAKRGLKGIGETAGDMAGHFDKVNSHLGEGLSEVVGNVEELGGSFKELGSTIKSIGKGGGASLMSLVPVLGGVVAAGFALFETFQMITGAAQEAEDAQEAMGAASADLQSKLEALAEQGVIPSAEAMVKFTQSTIQAQFAKDRLEKSYNKLLPLMKEQSEIQSEINDLLDKKREADEAGQLNEMERIQGKINELEAEQKLNIEKTTKAVRGYRREQVAVQGVLKAAAKQEEELNDLSFEATMSRIKESAATVLAFEKEQKIREGIDDFQRKSFALEADRQAELLKLKISSLEEEDIEEARALEKQLKAREKNIDKRLVIERKFNDQYKKLSEEEQAIFDATEEKKRASFAATKARQLMLEQRTQQELFALRALQLQQLKQQGASEVDLLNARHQLEIDQAGNSANKILMADIRHEMAKSELVKSEEAKRQAERDKRQAEILSQIDERNQREREYVEVAGEIADKFGGAFAEAALGAAVMGESFSESIGRILQGLGKQSAVEALIETAKGFASLAILDAAGAATHFKSAALFTAGALAAGAAGTALAGGGGGGGGGGASPSGAPQTAPTPQRETAQETSTVFNINFGGAVIYDTKQAAERAMVDRLVGVINQRNRGSRRLNLGSV